MSIHPTAIVEEGAQLGAGCMIHAYAIVKRYAILGDGVVVHPFSVVGGDPQALRFDPAVFTGARVGARTVIRESVTVNRSTEAGKFTEVGENCLLMACSHVAHDCVVGNHVVVANAVLLAGHVEIADRAILGGGSLYHQFARVGENAMISGGSHVAQDVPPFAMAAERSEIIGLNLIGLKRRGFPRETIQEIKNAFRAVYFTRGNIRDIAREQLAGGTYLSAEAKQFLGFFAGGQRGFARARRAVSEEEPAE
jgi:UDP-N-acetylglucosamine acyltransferase